MSSLVGRGEVPFYKEAMIGENQSNVGGFGANNGEGNARENSIMGA